MRFFRSQRQIEVTTSKTEADVARLLEIVREREVDVAWQELRYIVGKHLSSELDRMLTNLRRQTNPDEMPRECRVGFQVLNGWILTEDREIKFGSTADEVSDDHRSGS